MVFNRFKPTSARRSVARAIASIIALRSSHVDDCCSVPNARRVALAAAAPPHRPFGRCERSGAAASLRVVQMIHWCCSVRPRCISAPRATFVMLLLAMFGCDSDELDESQTTPSALTTRITPDGYVENNAARVGIATSSGAFTGHPASLAKDGLRSAPWDGAVGQYKFWASTTSSSYFQNNCYAGSWWVAVSWCNKLTDPATCYRTINELDLFSLKDDYYDGADPTRDTIAHNYGNVNFRLQYCPVGRTCLADGTGWVTPPGGWFLNNRKAWTSVSFPPIAVTAVRVALDCIQDTRAYVVELEAWERPAASNTPTCPSSDATAAQWIPNDGAPAFVGDDNSSAAKVVDADRWWWKYFGHGDGDQNNVTDDVDNIDNFLGANSPGQKPTASCSKCVGGAVCVYEDNKNWCAGQGYGSNQWWYLQSRADALVQMYDLLASVGTADAQQRANVYLERLRQMSNAYLDNRDDKRSGFPVIDQSPYPPPPYDTYHRRVMPAWGRLDTADWSNGQDQWTTYVDQAAFYTYPMAVFARRVAEHPERFCLAYRQEAIKFTNAVVETYAAYRSDMTLADANNHGYYRGTDGKAWPYNVTLSALRPMVEIASAADSELYRSSTQFNPVNFYYATNEAPRFIQRNVKFFVDNLHSGHPQKTSSGSAYWYWWNYADHYPSAFPEDLNHASLTLGSLLLIWENRSVIDSLLARAGNNVWDRIEGPYSGQLNNSLLTGIANTFLQRIWYYDYTPGSYRRNLLANRIDGPNNDVYPSNEPVPTLAHNGNPQAAGFIPLAQLDPWVWVRARDATFKSGDPNGITGLPYNPAACSFGGEFDCQWPALNAKNHAFLLRYR
jgi:hypothetical protein